MVPADPPRLDGYKKIIINPPAKINLMFFALYLKYKLNPQFNQALDGSTMPDLFRQKIVRPGKKEINKIKGSILAYETVRFYRNGSNAGIANCISCPGNLFSAS